jgi:hypothetical protein
MLIVQLHCEAAHAGVYLYLRRLHGCRAHLAPTAAAPAAAAPAATPAAQGAPD